LKGVSNANTVVFGEYGIQALEPVWLTSRQIEATRRTLTRYVRNNGKIWIRIFPDKPITERAAESRMGSGKGTVEYWVAVIKPGAILFEINGLDKETARKVLKLASYKLPIKTKIIEKI
jgi:large subunit ribosomal protein L16